MIQRDHATLQLGTDSGRRILIRDAPPGTWDLLTALTGHDDVADVTRAIAGRHAVRPDSWDDLLTGLHAAGYLADARSVDPHPDHTPLGLITGVTAGTMMMRRRDATVVVVGAGRTAGSVATLLAAAGVGHIYQDPQRSSAGPRPGRPSRRTAGFDHEPQVADPAALAVAIRRAAPRAMIHPPTGFIPPDLVVLAADGPPDQAEARRLGIDGVPHLAVLVGEHRGIVGPLVLPGRSSCLHCHDLYRRDQDPGWPQVLLAMQQSAPIPPAVLAMSVAALAAGQILQFVDGGRLPDTVDGTLESTLGEWAVRRRSWQPHARCFCQSA